MTRGRVLGQRLVCTLCGRKGYANKGNIKRLASPVAYQYYPRLDRPPLPRDATVWLNTEDHVCTFHIQLKPQPPRPAEVS